MDRNVQRPPLVRLLRYLLVVAIAVAISAILTAAISWVAGWRTMLSYGKALFWAGFVVMLLGGGRFLLGAGHPGGVGGRGWEVVGPARWVSFFWGDVRRDLDMVVFLFLTGIAVSAVGWMIVAQFTSCTACVLLLFS